MALEERCLNQGGSSLLIEGKIINKCSRCSYDSQNNPKCPYYIKSRIVVFNVVSYVK